MTFCSRDLRGLFWAARCLPILLLAACAETPERNAPTAVTSTAIAGESSALAELLPAAPLNTIPLDAVHAAMNRRNDSLRQLLGEEIVRGAVSTPALQDDHLLMAWQNAALFGQGTAQLQPAALSALSRIAKWLRADGALVLQIVGQQPGVDPDLLAERRAAAVQAFMIAEGALAPRVRAQVVDVAQLRAHPSGGVTTGTGHFTDGILLVIVPVVAGREALAWAPPAVQ